MMPCPHSLLIGEARRIPNRQMHALEILSPQLLPAMVDQLMVAMLRTIAGR